MKKCLILIVSFFLVLQLKANDFSLEMKKPDVFNHLDVALTLGTTGIGFDLATPIYKDLLQLRAGSLAKRGIEWKSPNAMNPRVMFD